MFKPCSIIFVLVGSVKTRRSMACLYAATCGEKTKCGRWRPGQLTQRWVAGGEALASSIPFPFHLLLLLIAHTGQHRQRLAFAKSLSIRVYFNKSKIRRKRSCKPSLCRPTRSLHCSLLFVFVICICRMQFFLVCVCFLSAHTSAFDQPNMSLYIYILLPFYFLLLICFS